MQGSLLKARALAALGKFEAAHAHFQAGNQDGCPADLRADAAFGLAWCEARGESGAIPLAVLERITQSPGPSWGVSRAAFELAQRWAFDFAKGSGEAAGESARGAYQTALLSGALDPAQEGLCLEYLNRLTDAWVLDPKAACTAPQAVFHTVAPGESLFRIARRQGVEVGQLCRINQRSPQATLNAGATLKVLPGAVIVRVDRNRLTLTLLIAGVYIRRYPAGIGPGVKTPAGRFTIRKKLVNPDWYSHGKRIPFGDPEHLLGTRWMGFDAQEHGGLGAGLGIHGTSQAESVPGRQSQGCVRMRNTDVEELYDFVPPGAVVEIE